MVSLSFQANRYTNAFIAIKTFHEKNILRIIKSRYSIRFLNLFFNIYLSKHRKLGNYSWLIKRNFFPGKILNLIMFKYHNFTKYSTSGDFSLYSLNSFYLYFFFHCHYSHGLNTRKQHTGISPYQVWIKNDIRNATDSNYSDIFLLLFLVSSVNFVTKYFQGGNI